MMNPLVAVTESPAARLYTPMARCDDNAGLRIPKMRILPLKPNRLQRALVLLLSCCFLATSCATTRVTSFPNEQTPNIQPDLAVGNTVRATLNTGEVRQFKVTAMEADALVGKNIRILYKDLRFLEVKKMSTWRSVGLGVGIVVGVATALFVYLVTHIESD
jgi:hypothetical protein